MKRLSVVEMANIRIKQLSHCVAFLILFAIFGKKFDKLELGHASEKISIELIVRKSEREDVSDISDFHVLHDIPELIPLFAGKSQPFRYFSLRISGINHCVKVLIMVEAVISNVFPKVWNGQISSWLSLNRFLPIMHWWIYKGLTD